MQHKTKTPEFIPNSGVSDSLLILEKVELLENDQEKDAEDAYVRQEENGHNQALLGVHAQDRFSEHAIRLRRRLLEGDVIAFGAKVVT
jgi:hypothetical protein